MDAEEAKLVQEYEKKLGIVEEDEDESDYEEPKERTLVTKVMETELYDWCPTKRYLLVIIAFGQRKEDKPKRLPKDMPDKFRNNMKGWCDQAQWRLAQRLGSTEDYVQELIAGFHTDGVVSVRTWYDSNHAKHNQYHVEEAMIERHQRPSQRKNVKRPGRYKTKRGANKGSFSSKNQPRKSVPVAGFEGQDDE